MPSCGETRRGSPPTTRGDARADAEPACARPRRLRGNPYDVLPERRADLPSFATGPMRHYASPYVRGRRNLLSIASGSGPSWAGRPWRCLRSSPWAAPRGLRPAATVSPFPEARGACPPARDRRGGAAYRPASLPQKGLDSRHCTPCTCFLRVRPCRGAGRPDPALERTAGKRPSVLPLATLRETSTCARWSATAPYAAGLETTDPRRSLRPRRRIGRYSPTAR